MIVTAEELIGLSSVSGGGWLPGVPVRVSGLKAAISGLTGLTKLGVIDGDGVLTDAGLLPVTAVKLYREANTHVVFNQLRVSVDTDGLLPDGLLTVLQPVEGGWWLGRFDPVVLMLVLLRSYPFLQGGGPDVEPGPWQDLGVLDWADTRGSGQLLTVTVMTGGQQSQVLGLEERDGMGFQFDVNRGRARVTPLWRLRHLVAGLLGCSPDMNVSKGGVVHG